MPRVFLGNFDFEHELAAGRRWQTGAALERINAELTCAWLAEATPDDVLWTPAAIDPEFLRSWSETVGTLPRIMSDVDAACRGGNLVPWGWSARAIEWGTTRGLICRHPPLEVVREVNCRLFSHALETEWKIGLPDSMVIRSLNELRQHLDRTKTARWVLKARFGMSGRERLLGRGNEFPTASLGWLESRLTRDGAVIFEPWVENVAEAGLQWEIPPDGKPQFLGLTPLLTDAQGGYRGNRLDAEPTQVLSEWQSAVEISGRAAERVQQLGYFGPLGIDAMQYRDPTGMMRLRPLQDINARWTMGRLTLGWRKLLKAGQCGTWLHVTRGPEIESIQDKTFSTSHENQVAECRIWRTSPHTIGEYRCQRASVFICAENAEARATAEAFVNSHGVSGD